MKIIYPNADGTIAIICPYEPLPIEECARKYVPFSVPYLIVADADVPEDWEYSAAWEADFAEPHGWGVGSRRWFIEQAQLERAEISARVEPAAPVLEALPELVVPAFEEIPWADSQAVDWDDAQRRVWYAERVETARNIHGFVVAEIELGNTQLLARHVQELAAWEQWKQAEVDRCDALIARMKAEVLVFEGVAL